MSERPSVILTRALPADWIASLETRCDLLIGPPAAEGWTAALRAALPGADALLTLLTEPVTAEILDAAPKLKVVSNMAVGVDNIDVGACTQRGIPVGHTPGVLTDATADLTFALLLAAARGLPQAAEDARAGRWTTWSPTGWLGADLHGATLGVLGFGKIGRAVCRRALGFGLRVLFTTRRSPADVPEIEGVPAPEMVSLQRLVAQSDFLSVHVPLTDETRGLVDADLLGAMKSTAVLINTARGPIVDTAALLQALDSGRLAGAALDVTDPEPLPPEHPLYRDPRVIVLPHIGSATHGTRRRMAELACDNVLAALEGRRLPHCVNPEVYPNGS